MTISSHINKILLRPAIFCPYQPPHTVYKPSRPPHIARAGAVGAAGFADGAADL
ncbi:MAG: hypothetical protein PHU34_01555 [Candidatus Methanoperedens sp.]|nr:hypothetical protein [Candidatus Methanoperedens sp.]